MFRLWKGFIKMEDKKALINDFMLMRNQAELKALSKLSLEQPLNNIQFERIMELKGGLNE